MRFGLKRAPAAHPGTTPEGSSREPRPSHDTQLVELVRRLSVSSGRQEVLALAASAAGEAIQADFVAVVIRQNSTVEGMAVEARAGEVSPPLPITLPLVPALARWMQASAPTVVSGSDSELTAELPPALWRFQSLVAFPLRFQSRAHGLILFGFEVPRALQQDEVSRGEVVAAAAAMAAGQASAEWLRSPQDEATRLLEEIQADWGKGTPTGELTERLMALAGTSTGAASVCVAEMLGESLTLRIHTGEAPFATWLSASPPPETAPWKEALATAEVSIGSAEADGPAQVWQEWMRLGQIAWLVALPLLQGGEVLGVFLAAFKVKPTDGSATIVLLRRLATPIGAFLGAERARKSAAQFETFFRSLSEHVSEAVLFLDSAGQCQSANGAAERLFGKPQAKLEGSGWQDCVGRDERERVQEWVRRIVAGELLLPLVVRLWWGENKGATAELRLSPVGRGEGYFLMARDLTAQVNTKDELSRVRSELASLLDSLDCGVLLCATGGQILFANQRLAQVLNLDFARFRGCVHRNQMLAQMRGELSLPEEFFERWLRPGLHSEEVAWDQLEIAKPRRLVERYGRPVYDEAGDLLGRLEIYRDVTGQAITEEKMRRADRMASLGMLISGVAHELSNPLTGVIGYSQLLLSRWTDRNSRKALELIHDEAGRAARIIRNLLIFARESKPERRPLDLNEIVRLTVALRAYQLEVENISVKLALHRRLPGVIGDRHQLQQVFLNLLLNAEQAILRWRGCGKIVLSTGRAADNYVSTIIQDDGPGIAPAIQSKIFDPFFTTKPPGEGTGLGLSIAYGIVSQLGGQIKVKSEPGCGAEFTVLLPATSEVPAEAGLKVAEGVPSARRGAHILVVEDEATVAKLIAEVLGEAGHEVETILDSREGLERIKRGSHDLVICDLKMPGLDGFTVYQELVNIGHPAQHRLLMITGDTLNEQTVAFLGESRLPHLAKPFTVEELKTMVHTLLAQP